MASALIAARGQKLSLLTKIKNFATGINNSTSSASIETRISKLEEIWTEFNAIEEKILVLAEQDKTLFSKLDEFSDSYFDVRSTLLERFRERQPKPPPPPPMVHNFDQLFDQQRIFFENLADRTLNEKSFVQPNDSPRLPRIHIEPFSGEYSEWPTFHDLYKSTVHHNTHLSNSHKFQILKGLLKGDAASLLRHLWVDDSTYIEAWEKIVKRYDRKRPILQSLIETFMKQPAASNGTAQSLRKLSDTSDELLRGIRALGGDAEKRDPWLIYMILKKTDDETQELWAKETINKEFPSFHEFLEFLNIRCESKENCTSSVRRQRDNNPRSQVRSMHVAAGTLICPNCKKGHSLSKCFSFKRMHVTKRRSVVNEYMVCYNCLREGHSANMCPTPISCKVCNQRHHTLLHIQTSASAEQQQHNEIRSRTPPLTTSLAVQNQKREASSSQQTENELVSLNSQINYGNNSSFSILPTALVHVRDCAGKLHLARVLLDSGSQSSFIAENLVQRLKLSRSFANIKVTGIGESSATTTKGLVSVLIQSRYNKNEKFETKALVLSKVTSALPPMKADIHKWEKLNGLLLADPEFSTPSSIDILIGADLFFRILKPKQIEINSRIIAQSTSLGWIIAGSTHRISEVEMHSYSVTLSEHDINDTLKNFWKLEEVPEITKLTSVEQQCEHHYQETTEVFTDGRYIVRLPFKQNPLDLGNSTAAAISRLRAMERKFTQTPDLKLEYFNFMEEYLKLGHMQEIPTNQISCEDKNCFYLPHHAVIKCDSTTTKLRVVFDGSCKSSTGISLNQNVMIGPSIQNNLLAILTKFRLHAIAFSADIEKMYRQVWLHKDDRDFQRIVWRTNDKAPIKHFKLNTVTYGTSCAPFLAVRSLKQIALDCKTSHPIASDITIKDFYIDDLLSGSHTVEDSIFIRKQICEMLDKAGFRLRKWKSNSTELLTSIPNELVDMDQLKIDDDTNTVKTLGLQWHPSKDLFLYKINLSSNDISTKRELLSQIARIFDPLGWISPVIIQMKILLQQLWLRKLQWDDELPTDIKHQWAKLYANLKNLQQTEVPRHLLIFKNTKHIEIHGFCDASELAYAAVIYLRTINEKDHVQTRIVIAKSKVAPLKQISLPRLELCGAVLLTKIIKFTIHSLNLSNIPVYAWSDSEIVLAWLSDVPTRWKCFVGNRTSQIIDEIPRKDWNHVRSKDNPADLASRGVTPSQLNESSLWWNGPQWLSRSSTEWPRSQLVNNTTMDQRKPRIQALVQLEEYCVISTLFNKFSSYEKIKRILMLILKCIKCNKVLALIDLIRKAEIICIRWAQQEAFPQEIKALVKQKMISSKSPLISLTPFLDETNVLRVGGRLSNMESSINSKHPIILPNAHILSLRIIEDTHKRHLHPGPMLLTSLIRQKFWIINCRNQVRMHVNKCIKCYRFKAATMKQLMGNLPATRISPSRPFLHTGVDYAGPVLIKARTGRGSIPITKAYICLFICFSTKAIHIELASDLTTEAYIASLRRFVSRRGVPVEIISDNGSNFIGAKNELHDLYVLFKSENHYNSVSNFLSQNEIKFSFNPASAPHFGGIWESNIKSIKHHLKRVTNNALMTFEEMSTLLTQIEAVLNSRPLCPLSNDVDDLSALTPSHFLIGESITAIPEPNLENIPVNRLSRWQNIQTRMQSFWKKWHLEYLHNLNQRPKWQSIQNPLKVDDLILIKEDNLPPSKWLMGRIIKLHPGSDGLTRVVSIKTSHGELKRPIVKICKLPLDKIQQPTI